MARGELQRRQGADGYADHGKALDAELLQERGEGVGLIVERGTYHEASARDARRRIVAFFSST